MAGPAGSRFRLGRRRSRELGARFRRRSVRRQSAANTRDRIRAALLGAPVILSKRPQRSELARARRSRQSFRCESQLDAELGRRVLAAVLKCRAPRSRRSRTASTSRDRLRVISANLFVPNQGANTVTQYCRAVHRVADDDSRRSESAGRARDRCRRQSLRRQLRQQHRH